MEIKMKKILAIILASLMIFAAVACDKINDGDTNNNQTEETTTGETVTPEVEKILGDLYVEKLVEVKTADPDATSMDVVEAIMNSKLGLAYPGVMPVPFEAGSYLQGLGTDGETFSGVYASATALMPMMMGQPFMVYVFDLAADADVEAFAQSVKANANPAWNICTTAETVTVGSCGNLVILAMCQKAIPPVVSGIAAIIEPEVAEGSEAAELFETFKTVMKGFDEAAEIWSEDVANALAAAGVEGEVSAAEDFISNDHFLYEIDGWGASKIANGDKLIYIFQLDMGTDVTVWADYSCAAKEGADLSFGSYNQTVIVMINFN